MTSLHHLRIGLAATLFGAVSASASETLIGDAVHLSGKSEIAFPRQCPPTAPEDVQARRFRAMQLTGDATRLGETHERHYLASGLRATYRETYGIAALDVARCTARVERIESVELVHGSGAGATVYRYEGRRRVWTRRTLPGTPEPTVFGTLASRLGEPAGTLRVLEHECVRHRGVGGGGTAEVCVLSRAGGKLPLHARSTGPDGRAMHALEAQRVQLDVRLERAVFEPPAGVPIKTGGPAHAMERGQ